MSDVYQRLNTIVDFIFGYMRDKRITDGKVQFYRHLFRAMPHDGKKDFKVFFAQYLGLDPTFDEAYKSEYE